MMPAKTIAATSCKPVSVVARCIGFSFIEIVGRRVAYAIDLACSVQKKSGPGQGPQSHCFLWTTNTGI